MVIQLHHQDWGIQEEEVSEFTLLMSTAIWEVVRFVQQRILVNGVNFKIVVYHATREHSDAFLAGYSNTGHILDPEDDIKDRMGGSNRREGDYIVTYSMRSPSARGTGS